MLEKKYQSTISIIVVKFPKLFNLVFPYRKIIKYVISGGLSALTILFVLYFFTDILGIWYVISSVIASISGVIVSFIFQKFWTFRNKSIDKIKSQLFFYAIITVINIAVNVYGVFALVDYFGLNYLVAQIIVVIIVTIASFFVYGKFLFKGV